HQPTASNFSNNNPTYQGLFFSSRRRHTSWPRDWSSDVCSSDLPGTSTPAGTRGFGVIFTDVDLANSAQMVVSDVNGQTLATFLEIGRAAGREREMNPVDEGSFKKISRKRIFTHRVDSLTRIHYV